MSELEDVRHAVQELANAVRADEQDDPALVGGILVLWEEVTFCEHGNPLHALRYASAGDNASPVLALGLLAGGTELVMRDGLGIGGVDDGDG